MNKKLLYVLRSVLSIVLAISILLTFDVTSFADYDTVYEPDTIYRVLTISSESENPFETRFIYDGARVYINLDSAATMLGVPYEMKDGQYFFTTEYGKVFIDPALCIDVLEETYIPFTDFVEDANLKVSTVGKLLDVELMIPASNIRKIIDETFTTRLNDPFSYSRDDKTTRALMNLSEGLNILYNFKVVSAVTGRYSAEKVQKALTKIIITEPPVNDNLSLAKEGHSLTKKLIKLEKYEVDGWDIDDWSDAFSASSEYAYSLKYLEAYNKYSKAVNLDEILKLAEMFNNYGHQNYYVMDGLKTITSSELSKDNFITLEYNKLAKFYSKNGWDTASAVGTEIFNSYILDYGIDKIDDYFYKSFGVSKIATSVERLILNELFDVQDNFDTVNDLNVHFEIQDAARDYWNAKKSKTNVKALKAQRNVAYAFLYSQLQAMKTFKKTTPEINYSQNENSINTQLDKLSLITDEMIDYSGNLNGKSRDEFEDNMMKFASFASTATINYRAIGADSSLLLSWYNDFADNNLMEITVTGIYENDDYSVTMSVPANFGNSCVLTYSTGNYIDTTGYSSDGTKELINIAYSENNSYSYITADCTGGFTPISVSFIVMEPFMAYAEGIKGKYDINVSGSNSQGTQFDGSDNNVSVESYPTGAAAYTVYIDW